MTVLGDFRRMNEIRLGVWIVRLLNLQVLLLLRYFLLELDVDRVTHVGTFFRVRSAVRLDHAAAHQVQIVLLLIPIAVVVQRFILI